jgi:hypothetical protein
MKISSPRSILQGVVLGAVLAAIVNVIIFAIGNKGAHVQVIATRGQAPVDLSVGRVIGACVFSIVLGGIGLLIIRRIRPNGFTLWASIAAIVAVVTISGPMSQKIATDSKVTLSIMHLVTGVAAIFAQAAMTRGGNDPKA